MPNTVRFALWGGEEQGLLGARAWVAQHLEGDAIIELSSRIAFEIVDSELQELTKFVG